MDSLAMSEQPNICVLIESWQMQCCGEPFKIGDTVEWIVQKKEASAFQNHDESFDYYYEHHSPEFELFKLSGCVARIRAIHCAYSPDPNQIDISTSKISVDVEFADGWDKDINGMKFSEYLVILRDVSILPKSKINDEWIKEL